MQQRFQSTDIIDMQASRGSKSAAPCMQQGGMPGHLQAGRTPHGPRGCSTSTKLQTGETGT